MLKILLQKLGIIKPTLVKPNIPEVSAYEEGRKAYNNDMSITDNPYQYQSQKHFDWRRGYDDAKYFDQTDDY